MSKQVKVYTTAHNPKTGGTVNLAPGDSVPEGFEVGEHVFADPGGSTTPTEPVAGPGQAALSQEQINTLQRQLDEATGDKGETGNDQTRTSASSSAKGGKS